MADIEAVAAQAIDCGLRIHRDLGPGLLESVYEQVLAASLTRHGLKIERKKPISFTFEGMQFADGFRIDLLVEGQLIIEIKSVETLSKMHGKQMLTYLRLMQQPVGLLMNFGGATFKEGIRRIVNNHTSFASSRLRVNQFHIAARANRSLIAAPSPSNGIAATAIFAFTLAAPACSASNRRAAASVRSPAALRS